MENVIKITLTSDPVIICDYENVYPPSDDTYLILDYFRNNINQNYVDGIDIRNIKKILDLGTGTGIIAIFLEILKAKYSNFNPKIYASDILEEAIKCAKLNEKENHIENQINFIISNLFKSFPENLKHSFNIIIFNPPYLPSSGIIEKNRTKTKMDYSWDGGITGYDVFLTFIEDAKNFLDLNQKSYIYFISSSRTNIKELNKILVRKGFTNIELEKKHIFFEDIILNRLEIKLA